MLESLDPFFLSDCPMVFDGIVLVHHTLLNKPPIALHLRDFSYFYCSMQCSLTHIGRFQLTLWFLCRLLTVSLLKEYMHTVKFLTYKNKFCFQRLF